MCYIASCVYPETGGYVCGTAWCWYEKSSSKSVEFGCWLCLHIQLTLCCWHQKSTSFRQLPVEKGLTLGLAGWCYKTREVFLHTQKDWDPPLPTNKVGWCMAQASMKKVSSFKVASHVHQQAIAFVELWAGDWLLVLSVTWPTPIITLRQLWASSHRFCNQRAKIYKWHQMIYYL